jgi:hypothetical protein
MCECNAPILRNEDFGAQGRAPLSVRCIGSHMIIRFIGHQHHLHASVNCESVTMIVSLQRMRSAHSLPSLFPRQPQSRNHDTPEFQRNPVVMRYGYLLTQRVMYKHGACAMQILVLYLPVQLHV